MAKKTTGFITFISCLVFIGLLINNVAKGISQGYFWIEMGDYKTFFVEFDRYDALLGLIPTFCGVYFVASTRFGFTTAITKNMDAENEVIKKKIEKLELLEKLETLEKKTSI